MPPQILGEPVEVLPGVYVYWSSEPTAMDKVGCDGLFISMVICDWPAYQRYLYFVGRAYALYSMN